MGFKILVSLNDCYDFDITIWTKSLFLIYLWIICFTGIEFQIFPKIAFGLPRSSRAPTTRPWDSLMFPLPTCRAEHRCLLGGTKDRLLTTDDSIVSTADRDLAVFFISFSVVLFHSRSPKSLFQVHFLHLRPFFTLFIAIFHVFIFLLKDFTLPHKERNKEPQKNNLLLWLLLPIKRSHHTWI